MNGVIVAEPIVLSDEGSHLLSITSTGSAKVVLTSSGVVPASQNGTWNITNITGTISLPTGAATSTGQATTNSKLDTIDTDIKALQPRKIQDAAGHTITSTSTGASQRSLDVNVANTITDYSDGPVTPGTAATKSSLIGGQYNGTLPTLTTGQQAAIQVDSRGRLVLSSTGAVSVNQGIAAATSGAWPVKITNGTTVVGVSTNAELRSSDTVNNGGVHGAITVGTSAVEAKVGASKLTNRKLLTVFHNGNGKLYWGYSNAVTSVTGTQIFKNTMVSFPVGDGTSVWLISDTAGQDVRITEGA